MRSRLSREWCGSTTGTTTCTRSTGTTRAASSPGRPGDSATAFTLTGLQARAADLYAQIRTPRQSWRTLEDVRPQLAEFELRCDTGDYDTAAAVLADIEFDYLRVWATTAP